VLTVSDTRNLATDRGGAAIVEHLTSAGHHVVERHVVPDDIDAIRRFVSLVRVGQEADALLITGGTGISPRDVTCEALAPLLTKPLPGYGELVRLVSYHDIGPAAMLSRASGGLVERLVVLSMPGSPAAVELIMTKIVLPELAHLVREANKGS
jgi:molybdenum cofactor biosynthesis protein B